MAVRYAMGAGRWHIARQLLLEGVLLGLVGGALGLLLAPAVCSLLVRLVFTDPSTEVPFSTHPDMRILLFNFGMAFVVSVLFSLAPAFRLMKTDLVGALKQQNSTAAGSPLRFRRIFCRRASCSQSAAADRSRAVRPHAAKPSIRECRLCHRPHGQLRSERAACRIPG